MKVLIIGSGGREHALAWKIAQSPRVSEILVAPGNGGTARLAKTHNAPVAAEAVDDLLRLAQTESIDLTVVGPEAPLVDGIVDRFNEAGLRCFGPQAGAAQLEGSKAFAKDFMQRHKIPTARYANFSDMDQALEYLQNHPLPVVIKASGLAAGKGVIIAENLSHAEDAVRSMLEHNQFGSAGQQVVIEEFVAGEEASFIVLASGTDYVAFPSSQDHKRAFDGDKGPNTGGMGAYSPAPVVTPEVQALVETQVIQPTLQGLINDGHPFTGFLYAGLMINSNEEQQPELSVLEFNCRMGDPETQPLMMRLNSDLMDLIEAALDNKLGNINAHWDSRAALGVVLAAKGYPGSYSKGMALQPLPAEQDGLMTFHAGTAVDEHGQLVSSGGRILCVTALGEGLNAAQHNAYAAITSIDAADCFYRNDIGHLALKRNAAESSGSAD